MVKAGDNTEQMMRFFANDATKYALFSECSRDKYLHFHVSAVYSDGTEHCNVSLLTQTQFKQWSSTAETAYLSYCPL